MQKGIAGSRNGCQLQGALETVQQIQGVVPIIHSVAGCGIQSHLAKKTSLVQTGYAEGFSVPATNVFEKQVIFGGGSRLREQIKNTAKIINGNLYFVLNSCQASMVGDDVTAMANEAVELGLRVLHCENMAGFKGSSYSGYETALLSLIDQLPETTHSEQPQKDEKIVNIFGILPGEDIFFRGNLDAITDILEKAGFKVQRFFGVYDGVKELEEIPAAGCNLVFSKWGVQIAEKLKEKYETDYLYYPNVPTGPKAVEKLLRDMEALLHAPEESLVKSIAVEQERFQYYLHGIQNSFYEQNYLKWVGLVGSESTVLQIGTFLQEYLGASIRFVIITDHFTKDEYYIKEEEWEQFAQEVYFTNDSAKIREIVEGNEIEVLLASALERGVADKKQIPLLEISAPVYQQTVLSKSYAGINGAVRLIEDYTSAIVEHS